METDIKINELLALKWKDINFNKNEINVQAYVYPSGTMIIPYKSSKDFQFSSLLETILIEYKKFRERLSRQKRYVDKDELIFGNDKGIVRSLSGVSHVFRKFLRRKGLDCYNITLKSLRGVLREQNKIFVEAQQEYIKNKEYSLM